ncbi:unnamed protein product [Ostreobium quekettii]|uniref:RRM domain-containing protein n=1 Tax=Ostreobium quekettii TaxID=121088 RepID=A0A8S1JAI3_9CHLO|nr:unnamed protein product [Ostreobium quekettii]|eukprot:evm.model.scf_1349.1 EVM.evm.TU.scf_1349.1   scf_1349:35525-38808(+)
MPRDRSPRRRSRSNERDRRRSPSRSREKYRDVGRSRMHRRDRSRSPRDRYRGRSRSQERGDGRRRSQSPGGGRPRKSAFSEASSAAQAQALQQLQQQQLQRQLLAQQLLLQQQALTGTNAMIANKKQREVYVGNLTIGVVTADMLRELFNGALSSLVPDPVTNPPVVNVAMDASGRFGFVEMRTEELATAAMQLDKVELCGRHINVGRPKGYVEPPSNPASQAKLGLAQMFAATLNCGPTTTVLLENMMLVEAVRKDAARVELVEDVRDEARKCGTVLGVVCPVPPPTVLGGDGCRIYVKFLTVEEAKRCKDVMDGRQFDGNKIKAAFVPEAEYHRAEAGEWVSHQQQQAAPANAGNPTAGTAVQMAPP